MLQLYGKVLQAANIEVKDLALTAINFTTYQFEISKQGMCHFWPHRKKRVSFIMLSMVSSADNY